MRDAQTPFPDRVRLGDGTLELAPLEDGDRDGLYGAAADPGTWAQHPARRRHERPEFDRYFDEVIRGGTLCARESGSGRIIGCSRFYRPPEDPADIAIGYTFLARSHWGGAWNRRMKTLMVTHAFAHVPRVWFHIAPTNTRSRIATERLGAVLVSTGEVDLGSGPEPFDTLVLSPRDWQRATAI